MTNAEDEWPSRVAILGVGLLGGSVALALRRVRPRVTLVGFARSDQKRQQLLQSGIVDVAPDSMQAAVQHSDVVVVASPVDRIAAIVVEIASNCPPDCLITDVGSTKAGIVDEIEKYPLARSKFVAAHPIAGSEKSGAEFATASLFDNKVIVLTPSSQTEPTLLERADRFWRLSGGNTTKMSPAQHDAHLAAVSHVPHLVSALVAKMSSPENHSLVGSGWQDITRVAAGDPTLWTAICQENRAAIRQQLDRFSNELDLLRGMLESSDDESLRGWLEEAKRAKEQTL